jgi:tetratricopeptide (TPR) repeat protein
MRSTWSGIALLLSLAVLGTSLLARQGTPPPAANTGAHWVSFHSRESGSGPTLAVVLADGTRASYPAVADTMVISYLADRNWGKMTSLSVSLGDTVRALVRFELPAGTKIRSAELVLKAAPAPQRPPAPFELSVHAVEADWDESKVTWKDQPKFAARAALTEKVNGQAKEVRLDVTALARSLAEKGAGRQGFLLKVPRALPTAQRSPDAALASALLSLVSWEKSVEEARKKAGAGRLVLAVVRASFDPGQPSTPEMLLLATALADPDVLALVRARFVPVRVSYRPSDHLLGKVMAGADPLADLGTSVREVRAPALVIADAKGKMVAKLVSIGTFDRDLVLRFLHGALAGQKGTAERDPWKLLQAGRLKEAEAAFARRKDQTGQYGLCRVAALRGEHAKALERAEALVAAAGAYRDEARVEKAFALMRLGETAKALPAFRAASGKHARAEETAYYLACLLHQSGAAKQARQAWQALAERQPATPWAIKARARLAWPDALATCESLTAVELPGRVERTEIDHSRDEDGAVRRAVAYLLTQQSPDGSWPTAQAMYRPAVTALAGRALLRWASALEAQQRARAAKTVAAATRWLDARVKTADPKTFDSFSAAYILDFFIDLEEMKNPAKGDTAAAVRLLLAGQCPGGGWSYSYSFGTSWRGGFGGWPKTVKGREHSMNTGPALLALTRAKERGHRVDEKALAAGRKALLAMRDAAGVYTYTHPEPRCFNKADQSIGRGPVCEHALWRLGAVTAADLETALGHFLKYHDDLRGPVKLHEAWLPPRAYSSYFYFFAYDHAARAIAEHGTDAAVRLGKLRAALLRCVEADGTWVDFERVGKPYATAMALHVLHLARAAREKGGKES